MHPIAALFRRNAWATDQLLEFCSGRPEAKAPAETDVYGSVESMFEHILGAERRYFRLVTGALPTNRPNWPAALEMDRDPEKVLEHQRGTDAEWMADWVPLVQCFHHGDDHRTQINTVLSRNGVEPPNLDGWSFGAEAETANGKVGKTWPTLLRRTFGHHFWATERLLNFIRNFTPEQLELSAPGTYGSLGATLRHLVSGDSTYISRLMGRVPVPLEAGEPELLLHLLARQREEWLAYLDSDPNFEAMVERRGVEIPAWVIVLQAIHHGNDHRAHAGAILLRHKFEIGDIDVWGYASEEGALEPIPKEGLRLPPP